MTKLVLAGAAIVTPGEIREQCALVIEAGMITGLVPQGEVGSSGTHIRLDGGYLVPGFIDIQVNGGGGILFNDEVTAEGIRAIAQAHRRFGTTTLLPTLISDTPAAIAAAIDAVEAAIEQGVSGVAGVHIEGPYLNPAKRGIHDAARIAVLDSAGLDLLSRPARGTRLVTLAPELCPPGTIRHLRQAGVIVCAGHSLASYEQAREALDEGLNGFTHLFNAMTQFAAREPGMVGAALEDRTSRFGLIADGHHVHPAAMRVALAARGIEGVMLVTDAMPPVGAEQDRFTLAGSEIICVDGALRGLDGTLAGSSLDMASALRNACTMLRVDLVEASRMASGNAAAFLGIEHQRGAIAPGLAADLVHLSDDLEVVAVWVGGSSAG